MMYLTDKFFNINWHLIALPAHELYYRMKYEKDNKMSVIWCIWEGHITTVGMDDNTVP